MDRTTGLREDAAVCDFVALLLDDLAQGAARPLDDYQARFPEFAERIAREYSEILADAAAAPVEGDEEPRDLGPYRLLKRLGHGGQGVVFLAEHRDLGRRVALKMLHRAFLGFAGNGGLGSTQVARLRREAMALARLDHPGICAVYDVQLDGPDPYLAMRFVDGQSIAARIRDAREAGVADSRRDVDDWLEFFERAARALHVAHQAGIVHRDIKPQNLMRTQGGAPVLLDFGLAREIDSAGASVTKPQDVFGTLPYLAPELLDGDHEPSPRADVYALGVTIYEALTRKPPFAAAEPSALREQILAGRFESPRTANPHLPSSLDLVLRTAMEQDPKRRYATAEAFAEDLRRVRLREPLLARPVGRWVRTSRWVRRHPAVSFSFALSLVALVVVLLLLARVTEGRSELRALRIAYQAQSLAERVPGRALVLAVEAAQIARHPEIEDVLLQILDACHEERTIAMPQNGRGFLDTPSDRLVVDPRQRFVAVPLRGGEVPIFRITDGEIERTLGAHGSGRTFASFTSDGGSMLTGGDDGLVHRWNLDTGAQEQQWSLAGDDQEPERLSTLDRSTRGQFVLVGGELGSVRILDLDPGLEDGSREIHCLGHHGSVIRSGFDRDDRRVFTLSADLATEMTGDRSVRVFETSTGELLRTFGPFGAEPRSAAWSPDGELLAIALADGLVEIRSVADGSLHGSFTHHAEVNCVVFDPVRPRICTGSLDGLWVRELGTDRLIARHEDFGDRSVNAIAFDTSGSKVAITARDGTTRIYDAESLELAKILRAGPTRPNDLAWLPDGSRVLTLDGQVHVWYADRRPFLPTMRGHEDRVLSARFSQDGERVISASRDGSARIWDASDGAELAILRTGNALSGAKLSSSGAQAILIGTDTPPRLWSPDDGSEIELGTTTALDAWFGSSSGASESQVVTVGADGELQVFDRQSGALEFGRRLHEGSITCAAQHPNTTWIATGGDDRRVVVFDCENRSILFETTPWPSPHNPRTGRRVFGVAFSPDGSTLVGTGEDLCVHAWSVPDGRPLWTGPKTATPGAVAVSSVDRCVVVGGQWSPVVSLFDLSDGHLHGPAPVVPDNQIASVRIHLGGDSDLALCADKNGRVALFELGPPRLRSVFRASRTPILYAEFSPDGRNVVTAAADGLVRVWPVDPLPVADRYRPSDRFGLTGR